MSAPAFSRPWYCLDDVVEEYKTTLTEGGERLPMLKALKIIRAIVVNVGIISLGFYFVYEGGDPTVLGILALTVLGAYNGIEIGDYLALVQAYQEVQNSGDSQD